ncbi:MAG: TIGR02391 family protein [Verrucomicrobiota bacterium JB022]|nr:TIGR02391 family protein [Verrucomicrobiota bacterium JB022]
MINQSASEDIEYVGQFGITQSCIDAILRYLQFDEPIREAKLITHSDHHAFLFYTEEPRSKFVVRAGFASGYYGEGSAGLAYVLSLLEEFEIKTEEYEVGDRLFQQLNRGQLTDKDLESIDSMRPVRPLRIHDYIYEYGRDQTLINRSIPIPIPLGLIDKRIRDLVVNFWTDPDSRINSGFRRIEDAIRQRCNSDEHGAGLFQAAFMGPKSILEWEGVHQKEQAARADLFKSVYGSFRNPRAHKELDYSREELLSEFLLLNQLFRFERDARERPICETEES